MEKVILPKLIIDGNGNKPIENGAIVIANDKILAVDTASNVEGLISQGVEVIEAMDYTAIPGLIDAHVHLSFSASKNPLNEILIENDHEILLRQISNAQTALRTGITTLRDCGAKGLSILSLQDAIDSKLISGPRIVSCGMPLTSTGGHCNFFGLEVDSKVEVKKATRMLLKSGVDFIKVMISGGNMTPGSSSKINQYNFDEVQTIVEQAHIHGKKVGAHVHSTLSIKNAVAAGVDVLEHCSWIGDEGIDLDEKTIEKMAEKNIYVCPAMGKAYILPPQDGAPLPEKVEKWGEFQNNRFFTTRKMLEMGVKIAASTDAGCKLTQFDEFIKTLNLMVEKLQMSPMSVLESATRVAAEALGLDKEIGTIEKGKKADIVLIKGNPLDDIMKLQNTKMVIKDGQPVEF